MVISETQAILDSPRVSRAQVADVAGLSRLRLFRTRTIRFSSSLRLRSHLGFVRNNEIVTYKWHLL